MGGVEKYCALLCASNYRLAKMDPSCRGFGGHGGVLVQPSPPGSQLLDITSLSVLFIPVLFIPIVINSMHNLSE